MLPSLKGRGWGWVGERSSPFYAAAMRCVPKKMTQRARAMRREPTEAEYRLWQKLSCYRPRFTRQLRIGGYIVDLACRQAKLAVEIDGSQHQDQSDYDEDRTTWLGDQGWSVVRLWNNDVLGNPEGAAEFVLLAAAECLGGTHPQPLPSREGRERKPRSR